MTDKRRDKAASTPSSGVAQQGGTSAPGPGGTNVFQRADLQREILAMLQAEIPGKSDELTMTTRKDEVEIDSIAVIQAIFKIEETFGVTIDIEGDVEFENAGQLVDLLIAQFPPGRVEG